jgi:hypothetical protein
MQVMLSQQHKQEIDMSDNIGHGTGLLNAITSLISGIVAWISLQQAQTVITFLASAVALVSGIFAARYYWYATKEKKETLKKLRS